MSTRTKPRSTGPRKRPPPGRRGGGSGLWLVFGGLAVIVVIAVVVAVLVSGDDGSPSADQARCEEAKLPTSGGTPALRVEGAPLPLFEGNGEPDCAVGRTLPTLVGENYDEQPVTVTPDGMPQVVMVVVHWCPHCQAEVPRIVELADAGVFDGVTTTIIPTNTNEALDNYPPSSWLEREQWPFRVLVDDTSGTAAAALGTTGVPYFVLVNPDGTIAGRVSGETDVDEARALVEALKAGDELPLPGTSGASTSTR